MDLEAIAQKLQMGGLNINANQIKASGKWESAKTFDNKAGSKSGRYIIGENICSWINNKSQEKGSFVLDRAKVISGFELDKKRREYDKAERDKYFTNALTAKSKFDSIKPLPNAKSGYLHKKKVENFGCKIDERGNLVIPLRSMDVKSDGTRVSYIRSLQTILPDGTKLLESGCEKKGNMHLIGFNKIFRDPENYKGEILIAEGYATAASIHMATGKPVVVAFDAGNLEPVMSKITKAYPNAEYTICADNDKKTELKIGRNVGVEAANACKDKFGCNVTIQNFMSIENGNNLSDFNDLHVHKGLSHVLDNITSDTKKTSKNVEKQQSYTNSSVLDKFALINPALVSNIRSVGCVDEPGCYVPLDKENPEKLEKFLCDECGIPYEKTADSQNLGDKEPTPDISYER